MPNRQATSEHTTDRNASHCNRNQPARCTNIQQSQQTNRQHSQHRRGWKRTQPAGYSDTNQYLRQDTYPASPKLDQLHIRKATHLKITNRVSYWPEPPTPSHAPLPLGKHSDRRVFPRTNAPVLFTFLLPLCSRFRAPRCPGPVAFVFPAKTACVTPQRLTWRREGPRLSFFSGSRSLSTMHIRTYARGTRL